MTKVGVISDIHGNYYALRSVLAYLRDQGCEKFVCLGDTCGYYSMVNECIDALRKNKVLTIRGNHDEYLLGRAECPRSKTVNECIAYQRRVIRRDNRLWCENLPYSLATNGFFAVHGGLNDPIDEYIEDFDFRQARMAHSHTNLFLSGHTHIPSIQVEDDLVYCNPGSVGQPRDRDPRSSCAIIDDGSVSLHRIEYPIERTAEAMAEAGFSDYYYRGLFDGRKIGEA